MSSRAKRINNPTSVVAFPWDYGIRTAASAAAVPAAAPAVPEVDVAAIQAQLGQVERDAFARGFAQGEASATATSSERGEEMLQRLTQTLQDLQRLRAEMIRQTERQMVQLALAVARRIAHREISLDQDLLIAMARVALERLGENARATVRLHPEDFQATGGARVGQALGTNVTVLADPHVERGGCRVESDLGTIDAGIDAQIQEIARALLGDDQPEELSNVA